VRAAETEDLNPRPDVRERILSAARKLAEQKPLDQIGLSEIARSAGVSWPTVKRHVGSREELREKLVNERPELLRSLRATRSKLLDAALTVFAKKGYDRATLDDIALEASMTKGAVYWHFESKAELFAALLDEVWRGEPAAGPSSSTVTHEGLEDRTGRFLVAQVEALVASRERARLLFDFALHRAEPELPRRLAEAQRDSREGIAQALSSLQDAGLLARDPNAEDLGAIWNALTNGIALAWLLDPESTDPKRLAQSAAGLLLKALRTRPQATPALDAATR
jgi:AcrR family transcriptional regulator